MMKLIAGILIVAMLSGCATLSSPGAFAACQAADAATTVVALSKGGVEANPLMAGAVSKFGYLGLIAVKVALVYAVWYALKSYPDNQALKATVAVGTVVTCGVAAYNAGVLYDITHINP